MRKNVAGQNIDAQMNAIADGTAITTGVTLVVTGDGVQSASAGTLAHKGNGLWNYKPTQGETNFNNISFTFISALAPNQTVQVSTISYDPHNLNSLGLTFIDAAITSRLASVGYTAPDNASITSNGNAIASLNNFNPATDTVANVTTVATCTNNTDMRGTNSANTVAPDNAGIASALANQTTLNDNVLAIPTVDYTTSMASILADTNELQLNQSNWLTATGFATVNFSDTSIISAINGLNDITAADVWSATTRELTSAGSGGATAQEVWEYATRALTTSDGVTLDELQTELSGLKNFDPVNDLVVNVGTVANLTSNNDKTGYSISGTITTLDGLTEPDNSKIITIESLLTEMTEDDGNGAKRYTSKALENMATFGGNNISGNWKWSTAINATDPTSGRIKVDNADYSLVTRIYMSTFTEGGFDAEEFIESLTVGAKLLMGQVSAGGNFISGIVNNPIIKNVGWYEIPITITSQGGSIGNNQTTIVNFLLSSNSTTAIATAVRDEMDNNSTHLTSISDSITALNNLSGSEVVSIIGTLENLSAAEVKAEFVAALTSDVLSEPVAVPARNAPMSDKIAYLFASQVNKLSQTSTTRTLRNSTDTADISSSTVSTDGTTTTKGKDS